MSSLVDRVMGVLAPHVCFGCGAEGSVLCDMCVAEYVETVQPQCAGCRSMQEDFRVCKTCRKWLPLTYVVIAGNYDGVFGALVKNLKFDLKRGSVAPMAEILGRYLEPGLLLCPIPTAPARVRQRGFDHALLLVRETARKSTNAYARLLRRHSNVRQLGSSRAARMKQMTNEFEVIDVSAVKDRRIILVDDVMTSGATLAAAAKTLKAAGAKEVSAIVFSRKV